MSLNIDLRALEKANVDQLQAFHLDEQVPILAADLSTGTGVYYQGRLVTISNELSPDSFRIPTFKELDVVIQKVEDLCKTTEFTASEDFEKSMDEIRKFAELSRILSQESKTEVAIESVLLNKSVDSIANVLGKMFQ